MLEKNKIFGNRKFRRLKIPPVKYFIKLFQPQKPLPLKLISIDRLMYSEKSEIYNRIENLTFKIKLANSNLVEYKKVNCHSNLPFEGENNKSYRLTTTHVTKTPEVMLYSVTNGVLVGEEGFIYDLDSKAFIKESIKYWFRNDKSQINIYRYALRFPSPVYLKGITLVIAKLGADGYYHFLQESITKILLFIKKYPDIRIDNLIICGCHKSFKENWINFLFDKSAVPNLVYTNGHSHIHCEQIFFITDILYQYSPNNLTNELLKSLIQNNITIQSSKNKKKIILASRQDANYRNLPWENEIVNKYGAVLIKFSSLQPQEVIKVCQECDIFIGAHGAAFSNLSFCNPKTTVIEIVFNNGEPLFSRLATINKLNHIMFNITEKKEAFNFLDACLESKHS